MTNLLIPTFSKIVSSEETPNKSKFQIEKLERGFGQTLGNSLRRTLLSAIPGASVFAINIKGVLHEFQPINNVTEDAVELILNIKNLVLEIDEKIITPGEVVELKLTSKSGKVKAKDIETPTGIKVINKNLVIAETNKDNALEMVIYAKYSRGFKTFEENRETVKELLGEQHGIIPIDSSYSPVLKVSTKVEDINPGETTVYEKLVLEIETNGSAKPEKVLAQAGQILRNYYQEFENMTEVFVNDLFVEEQEIEDQVEDTQLDMTIEELNLSKRSFNSLQKAGIITVSQLIDLTISTLKNLDNLGEKSVNEIINTVNEMGLAFKAE